MVKGNNSHDYVFWCCGHGKSSFCLINAKQCKMVDTHWTEPEIHLNWHLCSYSTIFVTDIFLLSPKADSHFASPCKVGGWVDPVTGYAPEWLICLLTGMVLSGSSIEWGIVTAPCATNHLVLLLNTCWQCFHLI